MAQYHSPSTVTDLSWYLDSGATDHVAPDLQEMNVVEEHHGIDKLQVRNGINLPISHIASTYIHNLKLPTIFNFPRITKCILGVSKHTSDNNIYMEFWPKHYVVKSLQGQTLLNMDVNDRLYLLPSSLNKAPNKSAPTMAFMGIQTYLHGWHKCLAHSHAPLLRRFLSSFKISISSNNFPIVCDSCQLGKSHRLYLPTSHVASSKAFDLIYSDVWGTPPFFYMNGNIYFLLIVDDYTILE